MNTRIPSPESKPAPARWTTRRVVCILVPLFLYFAFPIGFWPFSMGVNECAHGYLALALAQRGETCVDQEVRDYTYNHDLVFRGGHFYSNKPPGAAFWLTPAAVALDLVTPGPVGLPALLYFGRVLMLTLPFMVFLFFLGRALERLAPPVAAWGLIVLYALATNAGAYATVYFAHNLAAMGLTTAFLILVFARPRWHWLGGLAAGLGVVAEYQTIGMAVVLAVLAFLHGKSRVNWKSGVIFLLGPLAPACVLLVYNYMSSGSAVELGYQTEFQTFGLSTTSSLGFGYPDPEKMALLLFSPSLGLFLFSPWLVLIVPAAVSAFRKPSPWRRPLIGALTAFTVLLLIIASHHYWVGGAITGPRYLTAALPFLLFPLAAWLGRLTGRTRTMVSAGLVATATVSALVFAMILAVTPFIDTPPEHIDLNPLTTYIFPLMARGVAALTAANVLGAGLTVSVVIQTALLLAAVVGFAVPALSHQPARRRVLALAAAAGGGVLFAIWTQIGSSKYRAREAYVDQIATRMALDNQPREHGRIRFLHRVSAGPPVPVDIHVQRFDPAADAVLSPNIEAERVARDFKFILGATGCPDGSLVISDVLNNTLHRYWPDGRLELILDMAGAREGWVVYLDHPGVNGVALDREGRLVLASSGSRNLARLDRDRKLSVLVGRFEGKRLNSPRCPLIRSDGSVFFVDPLFGLNDGPRNTTRELEFCGIYRWSYGKLTLLNRDLTGPTGLAFSPDEKFLYVADWCQQEKLVYRYQVDEEGNLSGCIPFARIMRSDLNVATTGLLTDQAGNLFVTGARHLWILAPQGKALAQVTLPELPTALAWGGKDGRILYVAGYSVLFRLRVKIPGFRPPAGNRR